MRPPVLPGFVHRSLRRALHGPTLLRPGMLALAVLPGCAAHAPPPAPRADYPPVEPRLVTRAHSSFSARQHGDRAMGCAAIRDAITEMDRRIMQAQPTAPQEADRTSPGDNPDAAPAAATEPGGILAGRKAQAQAAQARARARVLVRLGRAKHCFIT